MEFILLAVVVIAVYFLSDVLLKQIELRVGHRLEHRELIYFGVFLGLVLLAFYLIRRFVGA